MFVDLQCCEKGSTRECRQSCVSLLTNLNVSNQDDVIGYLKPACHSQPVSPGVRFS